MRHERLQSCINYLLTVSQHEVFQVFSDGLSQFNITPGQYGVLRCLWEDGPCTPKEIAQTLRLENSTISGVLDRMEKKDLIRRVTDENDRRSVRVVTTELGSSLKEDVLRVIGELNDKVLSDLTGGQREALIRDLSLIGKVDMPEEG